MNKKIIDINNSKIFPFKQNNIEKIANYFALKSSAAKVLSP